MFTKRRTVLAAALMLGTALAGPGAFAQQTEVDVLLFSMPSTLGLQKLAPDFEAETGIKTNIEVVGQDVFESRITLSFTGGTGDIDVVHTPAIQVQRWVEAGWLAPLTQTLSGMPDRDDIIPATLDSFKVGDDHWGIPFFAETGLLAYRKDLLEAAGKQPPTTWEEMLDVAAAIHSPDTAGVVMRAAPGQGFNMFVFPMIMRAYGGEFFADYPDDLTPTFNSPETLSALDVYIKLLGEYGPNGVSSFNFPEVVAAMQAGQAAMTVDGTSIVSQAVDPQKSRFADQIELALPPAGPAERAPALAVHGLGVSASAKDPEAAAKFVAWATSKETMTKLALNEAYPDFTRASIAEDPAVKEKYAGIQADFLDLRIAALQEARSDYRPLLPTWPELGAAMGENVNAALNGMMEPQEALDAANEEMGYILGQ
ncbi:ABC transporter substrate-binding protein [Falsirhodobacter sp. 20TX0035]|uniref:ABC transporter substrate-binding protein n=1 Tax=Falsirhodobacter sp. 20TX0035 TaxID=3022019 RepID=UPI00233122B1|nr:sugar ABC transporter substrate-binding protein [Falsirhodobacter sp. 20TX0035]MDB6454166.1 sugar ABC transporter substrate-binding protein [Falsirhodobacter sp. 20TX0035]